jgi:hypothetical protein
MTGSISWKLYQRVLLLYPEPFRHEFGDEMLSIFEECRAAQGSSRVLADAVLSAVKQKAHYHLTHSSKTAPLYAEIGSSPSLARILAIAICGVVLISGVLTGGKPKAPESWTMVPSKVRFWFPTGIVIVERKPNTPESWRVLRAEDRIWFTRCSGRLAQAGSEVEGEASK